MRGLPEIIRAPIRDTTRHFMSVAAVGAVIVGLNVLAVLYLARELDLDEYGQVLYFLNWFGVLRLIMGLGLGTKISKDLSKARCSPSEMGSRFWTLLTLRGVTTAVLSGVALVGGILFQMPIFSYAAVAGGLAVLADFMLSTLSGLRKVAALNVVMVIQPISYLTGISVWLVLPPRHSPWSVMGIYALSHLVALALGIWLVWRSGIPRPTRYDITWSYIRVSLHFAGLVYLLALMMYFYGIIATMFLGLRQMYEQVASFGVPLNLVMLPASIGNTAIISTFYPKMCELAGNDEHGKAVNLFETFFRRLSLATMWVSLLLALYPREILSMIYSSKYASSATTLTLLAPMVFLVLTETLLVFSYVALGKPGHALLGYAIQSILLIFGIVLAGVGTTSTSVVEMRMAAAYVTATAIGTLVLWLVLRRHFAFVVLSRNLLRPLPAIALIAAGAFAMRLLIVPTPISAVLLSTVATAIYAFVIYRSGAADSEHVWLRA
jgi:O-antigen/teichoic acid export membrane protein